MSTTGERQKAAGRTRARRESTPRGPGASRTHGGSRVTNAPILMYHAVCEGVPGGDPYGIRVAPERFEEQMDGLARRGLRGVSMRELRERGRGRRNLVGLTFDDGYADFLEVVVPTLERRGFSATVFAIGGMLGGENLWDLGPDERGPRSPRRLRLMDNTALQEADARGMEIGSHGLYHLPMTALCDGDLAEHLAVSRRVLGRVVGRSVDGLCYPYGEVDGRVARAAREAGYAYACSHKTRPEGSEFDLPRIYVGEGDGPLKVGAKLALARRPGALGLVRALSGLRSAGARPRGRASGRASPRGGGAVQR